MQNKKIEKDGPANSGNVLLDYIVNNKCEIAVKQGIECTVKIEVPYKFPFSDGDIFIILGNALDNAIRILRTERGISREELAERV